MTSRAAHLDLTENNPTFRENTQGDTPSPPQEPSHIYTAEEAWLTLNTGRHVIYENMSTSELLNVMGGVSSELKKRINSGVR